jgi:hypothetical protein
MGLEAARKLTGSSNVLWLNFLRKVAVVAATASAVTNNGDKDRRRRSSPPHSQGGQQAGRLARLLKRRKVGLAAAADGWEQWCGDGERRSEKEAVDSSTDKRTELRPEDVSLYIKQVHDPPCLS